MIATLFSGPYGSAVIPSGGLMVVAAIMGWLVDAFGPYKIAIVPAAGMTVLILWMALRTPIWNLKNEAFKPKSQD